LLCAAGAFLLRFAGDNYWTTIFPGVLIFSIGLTALVAPLTTTVLAAVEDRFAGIASGTNNAAARAGSLLAVAALPFLVGLSGAEYAQAAPMTASYRAATLWCAAFLAAGGLIAHTLPRTTSAKSPD
jgi:hypothetical protein